MPRIASFNAHDCIGRDGRYAPERTARLIAEFGADVVALQEITLDHAGDVLACLEQVSALRAIDGTLFERGVGRYGNVVLTRHPVIAQDLHDLSVADREPRGVIDLLLKGETTPFRMLATHLGLGWRERSGQLRRLATLVQAAPHPTIIAGDLNTWPGSFTLRPLIDAGFKVSAMASYPTWWHPLLRLDRILVRKPADFIDCWRHETPASRIASDHFPIIADVDLTRSDRSSRADGVGDRRG